MVPSYLRPGLAELLRGLGASRRRAHVTPLPSRGSLKLGQEGNAEPEDVVVAAVRRAAAAAVRGTTDLRVGDPAAAAPHPGGARR